MNYFNYLNDLKKRFSIRGQNAVSFMVVVAVVLTVVGVVGLSAAGEFEKTLALSSVSNTMNSFAFSNDFELKNITTTSGNGYFNFSVVMRNKNLVVNNAELIQRALQKIALVLNQPVPIVDANNCSQVAHFTYCVKMQ